MGVFTKDWGWGGDDGVEERVDTDIVRERYWGTCIVIGVRIRTVADVDADGVGLVLVRVNVEEIWTRSIPLTHSERILRDEWWNEEDRSETNVLVSWDSIDEDDDVGLIGNACLIDMLWWFDAVVMMELNEI